MFELLELEAAEQAVAIAENEGVDRAEEFLVNHISPEWVEKHKYYLAHLQGFKERFPLTELAVEDYKAGRHYASVMVTLSLIDGWINELNIVDNQRKGFFSDKSQLVAWDSITAHPKGLPQLQRLFSKARMTTRTEEITIPYRNGILHGMDLGYDNVYVAAKCWAALFAIRDWVIKYLQDELIPPVMEPEAEKSLWESIEDYWNTMQDTERIKQWQPRQVIVGETIPSCGEIDDYPPNSPERKTIEFLGYWKKRNFGYMAKCYAPMLEQKPVDVNEVFNDRKLLDYSLEKITEENPFTANVRVRLKLEIDNNKHDVIYEFRVIVNDEQGKLAYISSKDTVWGIASWRTER